MKFHTGIYIPTANKCKDTKQVKYRSSYEHAFAKLLDDSTMVERWEFESMYIAYNFLGKRHKYLIDFVVWLTNGQRILVEVKPMSFYKKAMITQDKNYHKWNAAISLCNQKGWKFKVITEIAIAQLAKLWKAEPTEPTINT